MLMEDVDRVREMIRTVVFFENRYGGTFEKVVMKKGEPKTSTDWIWCREGKEWGALLKELNDL
jgi:hypothetical protein